MWGRNPSKSKNVSSNDVEVEVSLDLIDDLYSIIVTEGAKLQSVVSVPTESRKRTSRRRFLGGIVKKNSSDDLTARMASSSSSSASSATTTSHRLADSLRPLSPNMADRHSAFETSSRERGRGASCPPSVDRSTSRHSKPELPRVRLHSCPPKHRQERNDRASESEARIFRESHRTGRNSKKPNLVSKATSRNRLFGSTGARKVIPAPTIAH